MKILINRNSSITILEQIYTEIENRIRSGILKPETRLPSIRKMCEELHVSPMTIVKVYNNLAEAGLVEKVHGRGTFVRSRIKDLSASQVELGFGLEGLMGNELKEELDNSHWQDQIQDYISRGSFRYNVSLSPKYNGSNLSIAALGQSYLPTADIFNKFTQNMDKDLNDLGRYPPIEGDLKMREAVREYVLERNIHTQSKNIIIASGSQLAINLVAMTYIGPGDVVVVGAPTFPGAIDVFKNRGAHIVEVPVDDNGMDTLALLSVCETYKVKLVYTMPSFQNPTGAVMTLERKQMILELADEHNFIILEDDVWSEVAFEGTPEPLKAMDRHERVIYICGFSKVYGPAYRLSAIIASGSLYVRLVTAKSNLDFGAPSISQKFLAPYLNSLEQKQFILNLKYELKQLRDRLYKLLKENLPTYVKVQKPKGGMLFWITFPIDYNCHLLHYRAVMECNISFLPGEFCYAEKRGSNQLRLCFTFLEESLVTESIKILCRLMDDVYKESRRHGQMPGV
ncbi:aminotransferase-like domain-containing protein [Anaeromicrobium sediminis]|uniref:HTH gntR-type domain-containing protein n=1 Tax=Anaeromicrobium sediminis TaxID=1478221 RepID=A0A267MMS7_9FIRM|nr:PLP-dependent aminotransferase family protein [Anaeromicrobium sediminis]PAB60175.1 hypothetical protein CCE28_07340 [Anaeromicrobium sediminis]